MVNEVVKKGTNKMGNNPLEWDKMPMDAVIKKANLTERDWYYLESRIRG